ncbi:MAG: 3-deoxy-D-manno-octulosonic acid kinase [Gammaproteobacteria bacterium]|nr:3-deoxy-D-manno-octulosonic acid kinase [Gammaproteobacteria bacterium]
MTHSADWQQLKQDKHQIWARSDVAKNISPAWFDAVFWQQQNAIVGESKGRYTTYFVEYKTAEDSKVKMVLRHYYRGGLISKLSRDRFIFRSYQSTRAFAELTMLQKMRELNLPVPKPVAAMVTKVGLFKCVNDILIELIPNARDGFQYLLQQSLSEQQWFAIGETIQQFHQQGVYHSDLNIHNIMLDQQGKVWLIDFDRCEFRTSAQDWQQANLSRLKRSLEKEKTINPEFHFNESYWQQLMAGYDS